MLFGWPNIIDISQEADAQFVHQGRAEDFCVTDAPLLGPTDGQCVEPGNSCAALLSGVGIVERIIIDEVVPRNLPIRVLASMRLPALSSRTVAG